VAIFEASANKILYSLTLNKSYRIRHNNKLQVEIKQIICLPFFGRNENKIQTEKN
jgi:hypothetical protein